MFIALFLAAVLQTAAAEETPPPLSPNQLLARVRSQFRSHRPPPAYETYRLERSQRNDDGSLDPGNSYVFHVWVRNADRAAMKRQAFGSDAESPPTFDRPTFNGAGDPGPPTADIFEPRPATPHPVSQPYTPEAQGTPMTEIGRVRSISESDYRVTSATTDNGVVHLVLQPISDPDRNRLREIFADSTTYELRKVVASDKLYIAGGPKTPFDELYTMTMGSVAGVPVVTQVHAEVLEPTAAVPISARVIDFVFTDIGFPTLLPDWYFDSRAYGSHTADLPQ